jgi:tetratricopeptide (TPR) repeat protein
MKSNSAISTILLVMSLSFLAVLENGCQSSSKKNAKEQINQALEHYYRGETLERKRDLPGAKTEYLASLGISPRPRALYRLAVVSRALNETDEAKKYVDEALKLSPIFPEALQLKQQLTGKAEKIPTGNTLTAAVPTNDITKTPPANAISLDKPQTPNTPPAAATPEISVKPKDIKPLDAESQTLLNQVKESAKAADWPKVIQGSEQILKQSPDHPDTLFHYGFALFNLNRLPEAEKAFRHAIDSDPQFAAAYNDLGVTLENLNRSSEAVLAYEKAIQTGTYADAYFNLALLKEKQGDYKRAITLYGQYIEKDTQSLYADYARGRIQKLQKMEF